MNLTNEFILVWEHGILSTMDEGQISRMYDMADCDTMESIVGVYAVNEENKLVEVVVGTLQRYQADTDPNDYLFYYGYSAIYAGSRRVGTIHYTDH